MQSKKKIIEDFLQKPSRYSIEVMNPDPLPENLKKRESIDFVVNPPTMHTLGQCAEVLLSLPEELWTKELPQTEAMRYIPQMIEIFCIMSWGKDSPYPEWYGPFLTHNLKATEMLNLFKELAVKSQTTFFLNSLKTVEAANPMTMTEWEKDSTPTDSLDK